MNYEYYFDILIDLINKNKSYIKKEVVYFEKSKKSYRVVEISNNLIMVFKKEYSSCFLSIGFPFPLKTKRIKLTWLKTKENTEVTFFLKGEIIRSYQREQLFKISNFVSKLTITKFKKVFLINTKNNNKIYYVDPYNYLGDSIIGLFFVESFKNILKIKDIYIFSKNSDLLKNSNYPSFKKNKILKFLNTKNYILIMPNMIDNQWEECFKIISLLKKKGHSCIILIPGRNLLIKVNKNQISTFWCSKDDLLLRNDNIEDYMLDCIRTYSESELPKSDFIKNKNPNKRILINPFSSREVKYLPVELTNKLISSLIKKDIKIDFLFEQKNKKHLKYIKNISNKKEINLISFKNLFALGESFKQKKYFLILSADTFSAHLSNLLDFPNFTFYNTNVWDNKSIQSLVSDSPLGFCRYQRTQLPVLVNPNSKRNIKDISKNVLKIINLIIKNNFSLYGLKLTEKEINRIKNLYKPINLTDSVKNIKSKEKSKLIKISEKISFLLKIKNLQKQK